MLMNEHRPTTQERGMQSLIITNTLLNPTMTLSYEHLVDIKQNNSVKTT